MKKIIIIREKCCRDLKKYLETALASAKGGVISVKLSRVLEIGNAHMWRAQYAQCLSRLLRNYRFNHSLYLLTRQQAEELLQSLDALCAELFNMRVQKEEEQSKPAVKTLFADGREKMSMVSFYIPRDMLQLLDEYARQMNATRSDVVRLAVKLMLDKIRLEEYSIV
jgi:hypothetical protein